VPVTIKGFYVVEVMSDLGSSANMMSLSLFNMIGGMELRPCEVRPFLATARAIIKVDQGKVIIRPGEDYITYKVFGHYHLLKHDGVPKEEPNLKVEEEDEIKEPEGQGLPSTSQTYPSSPGN
jgi:hypothetical protein